MKSPDSRSELEARAAAEEVLRIIYGDDLEGCTVSLDRITEVIAAAISGHARENDAVAELHEKGFEAIRLLATPPANGSTLGADELRTLLGERLDTILGLASKVISATKVQSTGEILSDPSLDEPADPAAT